ncbi:MAG: glycosyltransferase family 1 protein [Candidatus Levybacteria bacterium]|nr:glycosyltransferase family 1 protein [Candidatus Levybacteria bacterium]
MKIGINGYEAVIPRFGVNPKTGLPNRVGSSEYCFNLLINLSKIDRKNEYFIYLPVSPTKDLPVESDSWHYKVLKKRFLWTIFDLSREFIFKKNKLDIFFSPTHYLPAFLPFKSAISIMDLSFFHFPELFKKKDLYQMKFWTKLSIRKAKRIFTISNASKSDIIKIYRVPESKVIVTYPGIKFKSQNSRPKADQPLAEKLKMQNSKVLKGKYGIKEDYILFVGTLQPRKNVGRLVEAFSKVILERSDRISEKKDPIGRSAPSRMTGELNLIIVGKKGWMYQEILEAPKKFGVEDRVKFLDFVPDEDLPALYKNALCFVLPSLYEGFGLPVLEAMQNGCPVITSNVSSLPEAGGDAALYVNPEDVDDIADKIQKVISIEKLRHDMIEKGYKQVKKFSWEKTAKETLEALEEIVKK